jgi:transposase
MVQRYDAVLGVIRDGFAVTEVASKIDASRQSVHTWFQRYEACDLEVLAERSLRPATFCCTSTNVERWMNATSRL